MSLSYIGRKSCGCVVAACVVDLKDPNGNARDVAGFIRLGLTVELVSTNHAREILHSCRHVPKKPRQALLPG